MSKDEQPLPKPPATPFGRKRFGEQNEQVPLMSDRIAAAMAEGKLEEFLKEEMPDNEHAKALVSLMMGMTGMMPSGGESLGKAEKRMPDDFSTSQTQVPPDIEKAVKNADVTGLMESLRKEREKRSENSPSSSAQQDNVHNVQSDSQPVIEKEVIDQLIKISGDNNMSIDWVILRAIKLYVEEYQKTGRL